MEYCFAQPTTPVCTIELFPPFLETVIAANVLKILCFALTFYLLPSIAPLVTFGDAVASFLTRPDPLTAGGRAVEREWLENHEWKVTSTARSIGRLYQEKDELAYDFKPNLRSTWIIKGPSEVRRWAAFLR